MTTEAVAAALLTADQGVLLYHHRRHIFEAHRRLVDGHIEKLSQPVNHHGVAQGLDYGTSLAADFQEVKDEQGEDLELVEEISVFIDDADAVGIAIVGYAHICLLFLNQAGELGQILGDWLGVDSGEQRVTLTVDLGDFHFAALEELP